MFTYISMYLFNEKYLVSYFQYSKLSVNWPQPGFGHLHLFPSCLFQDFPENPTSPGVTPNHVPR